MEKAKYIPSSGNIVAVAHLCRDAIYRILTWGLGLRDLHSNFSIIFLECTTGKQKACQTTNHVHLLMQAGVWGF